MGILNLSPDSFSGDGLSSQYALPFAKKLIRDGADIIDIGGESTRPGARQISIKEELNRIIPIIKSLVNFSKIPISVDTYKSAVAEYALDAGASIINNIKGVKSEKHLLKMVRNYQAAIVLMHIQGAPTTMQRKIQYKNIISDIIRELKKAIENCLEIGIKSDKIIIDPGIGFGKSAEDNLKIIHGLDQFQALKYPVLIGPSRKSFIGKILNKDVGQRLTGTMAALAVSIYKGAHIIRVHDVKDACDIARLTDAIINEKV